MPGSGADIMQVRNGVYRPVALHEVNFHVATHPWKHGGTIKADQAKGFMKHTMEAMDEERLTAEKFSLLSHISLLVNKVPLHIFAFPLTQLAKWTQSWGMDDIPPGRCPGLSMEDMQKKCAEPETKEGITNHMSTGFAMRMVIVGLVGWALFKAIHDCMLLLEYSEKITIAVGALSTAFQGLASGMIFFWAMGAASVFTAEVEGRHRDDCLCFYQLEPGRALIALATPFLLLVTFVGKVQMIGMSMLYGDYVYFHRYDVPHYLAKQSMLWSWQTLISPRVAGTRRAEGKAVSPREDMSKSDFQYFYYIQFSLWALRLVVLNGFVALAACPFMVRAKEMLTGLLMSPEWSTPARSFVLRIVVLPFPAVFSWCMGLVLISQLYYDCFPSQEYKSFADFLDFALPDAWFDDDQVLALKHTQREKVAAWATFLTLSLVIGVLSFMNGQGLCPDRDIMLGANPHRPSLVQAELWGACGFVFMMLPVQRCMSGAFDLYDDMRLLSELAGMSVSVNKPKKRENRKMKTMRTNALMTSPSNAEYLELGVTSRP
eukprot:gnl/TRDRNA2_/TRDRNA2_61833_c0_seq2.p1 gnl/TRDRNA2_/TRDRNA2_61833_c0~~gnl/TRDRNA2_/TRDRNA2_61833_c0_seq2.p1  ORF type:complete len:620 (-),score=85.57 gnl/TRDRNA2_/TRDRNA2_61833_c0_seq2:182-1816(-)